MIFNKFAHLKQNPLQVYHCVCPHICFCSVAAESIKFVSAGGPFGGGGASRVAAAAAVPPGEGGRGEARGSWLHLHQNNRLLSVFLPWWWRGPQRAQGADAAQPLLLLLASSGGSQLPRPATG